MSEERPEIRGIVNDDMKETERFQNDVLRPILKQQHFLLLNSFTANVKRRKINFDTLSNEHKEKHIDSILSKDISYKNILIGMIIGRFTLSEFSDYEKNSNEYNRRILQMLKKRLKDTLL